MSTTPDIEASFADYFRDPDAVGDSPLAYQIEHNTALVDGLRSVLQGHSGLVRLRVWMLLTLVQQGSAFLSREALDQLFFSVRPEAVDSVVKRLRDAALLSWDETQRHYGLTPLAQQVATMLSPLTQQSDDELSGLLAQVVGADRLGTLDGAQVQMLQAQLGRLHHAFADAIASGSEFRLREARKRYDRASRLIDKASDTITAIIGNARGQLRMEQAARSLGQAQSRLLAMASQFNRALQQVDRQRVTLGTTGITSTDVKRWLQTQAGLEALVHGAMAQPVGLNLLSAHELLDVGEAEFERDRPQAMRAEPLPTVQIAPEGDLHAVALPQALGALSGLLAHWGSLAEAAPLASALDAALAAPDSASDATPDAASDTAPNAAPDATPNAGPDAASDTTAPGAAPDSAASNAALLLWRSIDQAVLPAHPGSRHARYAEVAYKTQLLPLLGDAQAQELPGATGELARQPWRVEWHNDLASLDHPEVSHLSTGHLRSLRAPPQAQSAAPSDTPSPSPSAAPLSVKSSTKTSTNTSTKHPPGTALPADANALANAVPSPLPNALPHPSPKP